jgi:hypothetical protein
VQRQSEPRVDEVHGVGGSSRPRTPHGRLLTGRIVQHLSAPQPRDGKSPTGWFTEGESVARGAAQHDAPHPDEPQCGLKRGLAEPLLDARPAAHGSCKHPAQVSVGKLGRRPKTVLWWRISDEVDHAGEHPPTPVDRYARPVRTRPGHRDREHAGWQVEQWDLDAAGRIRGL